jgi:hypothetical protein
MSAALWDTSSRLWIPPLELVKCMTKGATHDAGELELILLVLGDLDVDARPHVDSFCIVRVIFSQRTRWPIGLRSRTSDNLLADEVPDLDLVAVGILVPLNIDVDRKTVSDHVSLYYRSCTLVSRYRHNLARGKPIHAQRNTIVILGRVIPAEELCMNIEDSFHI